MWTEGVMCTGVYARWNICKIRLKASCVESGKRWSHHGGLLRDFFLSREEVCWDACCSIVILLCEGENC